MSPPTRLSQEKRYDPVGWVFEPPPADSSPTVSAEEAVRVAWLEAGEPAKSVQPIFALLPAGGTFETSKLVWLVVFPDVRVESHGQSASPSCHVLDWNVVVDARAGKFISAFGFSREPAE